MLWPTSVAALAFAAVAQAAAIRERQSTSTGPTVQLKNGTVTGVELPTFNQEAFYGVRYAQPAQRLRRPSSLNSTFESYDATNSSIPFCPGFGGDNWPYSASEDCLFVTVVRPKGVTSDSKLPSACWYHGGGYQQGGIADIRYNSSWLIQRAVEMEKPMIWVAVAYRTAAGGFLNSAEIEAAGQTNIGLYDQLLALQWWQENGPAFGADPSKVVLMGESAGAFSIGRHLLGFGDRTLTSLFRGAILESGGATSENFLTSNQSKATYDSILEKAGCTNATSGLDCLRALPFDTWNSSVTPVGGWRWNPTADYGYVFPNATAQIKAGQFVQVPLLIGANADEGTAFGAKGMNTTEDLKAALYKKYPGLTNSSVDALLQAYADEPSLGVPVNTGDGYLPTGVQDKRSNAIFGDSYIVAPRRLLAESSSAKVFSYEFAQIPQNGSMTVGATHFTEVCYVFSNPLKSANTCGNRPTDLSLQKLMTSYWVSFIHNLDPNDVQYPDAPVWPEYSTAQENMVFTRQRSYTAKDDFRKEGIALMNTVAFGEELCH